DASSDKDLGTFLNFQVGGDLVGGVVQDFDLDRVVAGALNGLCFEIRLIGVGRGETEALPGVRAGCIEAERWVLGDKGASAVARVDEAIGGGLAYSKAHGSASDAVLVDELGLAGQFLAGGEFAHADRLAQVIGDLSVERDSA